MKCALCILWLAASSFAWGASPQTLSVKDLQQVDFEQRLGATLPLNAMFLDESGNPVRLGNYFGDQPVILALAYYECPNLCTVVLNGMLESVRDLRLSVGKDYQIIVVSIHPDDVPSLAAKKKQMYATRYGRPGTAAGWHFLTGSADSIREITQAAGFHYLYDPATKQYAHASGILVATPGGKISRYFLGIEYPPKDLNTALTEASHHQVGTLANRLLLLCFHYDPVTGRYSLIITRVLQIAGLGTAGLLAAAIVMMTKAERRIHRKEA